MRPSNFPLMIVKPQKSLGDANASNNYFKSVFTADDGLLSEHNAANDPVGDLVII